MITSLRNRLSFANVVACIALFVALGGTGYAAVTINGKNIKNRSISGKKLKNNTLTGKQIKESRLGKVPRASKADSATSATSATTAGNANTVGGKSAAALTVRCPAGTDLTAGVCIELQPRPTTGNINQAAAACGQRALPTVPALIAFVGTHPGQTGVEFTSDLLSTTDIAGINMATGALSAEANSAHQYRCTAPPTN